MVKIRLAIHVNKLQSDDSHEKMKPFFQDAICCNLSVLL